MQWYNNCKKYYNQWKIANTRYIIFNLNFDIVSGLAGKNLQCNGKEEILTISISNLIDCQHGDRIFLVDDCTFNTYLNVLIQRKSTTNMQYQKRPLFIQISNTEYFDEQEVTIPTCINSLCDGLLDYWVVSLVEYIIKAKRKVCKRSKMQDW